MNSLRKKADCKGDSMAWDPIWEKIYQSRELGKYPPEELIRFMAKNYYPTKNRKKIKVLEIGFASGANIWFLAREGFNVYGIDGAPSAIKVTESRLKKEKLKAKLVQGDFAHLPWLDNYFDAVVDVAGLQHNGRKDSEEMIEEVYRVLKPGGRHFSLTAKNDCWGNKKGIKLDRTTCKNVTEGPFKNLGVTRFADAKELKLLYRKFKNINLETSMRTVEGGKRKISHWILTCQK
jgi:ubiquinone/menaquinone biosynthesis C-methylase UbiE